MTVSVLSVLTRHGQRHNAKHLLVLNLMPNRAVTERQFTQLFERTGQDVDLSFVLPATHRLKHDEAAIRRFYPSLKDVADQQFDGLIVTGAPLDQIGYEQVDFWPEFQALLAWRQQHVLGSLFICWGADAAGHALGTFDPERLSQKINGVYTTDGLTMPQSRYFRIPSTAVHRGKILAQGDPALGVTALADSHDLYLAGHFEYQTRTLMNEFYRDLRKDPTTQPPAHYLDDDFNPHNTWQHDAETVYATWLNQLTH